MRKYIVVTPIIAFLTFFMVLMQPADSGAYGWGFKKNTDHQIPDIGEYKEILKEYGAYYVDDSGEKNIYLTFDNGYEAGYTDEILDVLKQEDVPATFFVTGHYVDSEPDLIARMVDEGHIIGNHSYHHPDFTIISEESMQEELETLEEAVANVSEQKDIKYLRPPKGVFNERTLNWANELGYIHVFWSLAFVDWEEQKGWEYAYDQLMNQIHPGAIMLLHTVSSDNAESLEHIIVELKEQGYTFKSLDDFVLKDKMPEGIHGF
ncbi:peptidoglycan-N-acetylmuramic acid deacetylase [Virgibacillus natechei]|uniref:Peptidoglycan-N-acetylmuramic acid deacetylase n=1 Tax=Virgibacillus natechei TaxID=1216297 RepID=A0ABS4IJ65_9BACI|nr:delta-lactam-biosynthetic de-N-acetylase [Virgibacillus natechei]MBP1970610.1 peptidoglycan-N-acetylmuramic acid deacetylase [Virgibacillus natechei]UZD13999.1 delta-lactam-biosynthetic de-N-acetylase [Virgibacillus natechei]